MRNPLNGSTPPLPLLLLLLLLARGVLGPGMWNIRYDELLREDLGYDIHLLGYADDVTGLVLAKNPEETRKHIQRLVRRLCNWLKAHGLELAASKTEMVVLTRQRAFEKPFTVDDEGVTVEVKH